MTTPPPAVILENSEAVYDYYLEHQQNRLQTKGAYAILASRYRPRISYREGARDVLRKLVKSDTRLIISFNHLTEKDPYTVAGMAWRCPLRPIIGRARVLAKDELFVDVDQRRKVDMMGGIPVFRGKNHGLRAVNAAGQRMMNVCAERVNRGDDLAIFPEGTLNLIDPTQVQHVGSGVGHITSRAKKLGVDVAMVQIGISYGPGVHGKSVESDAVKRASFFVDTPILEVPDRPIEISRMVAAGLQQALDGAVERY